MTGMNRKGKPKTPEEELKKQTLSLTVCVNRSTSLKKKKICTGSHIGRDQS